MKVNLLLLKSVVFSLLLSFFSTVSSDMLISPTRILLTESDRSATLVLRNPSDGPRTYRLSWQNKRANEQGGYSLIEEGDEWPSASEMLRISPRQITVGPNENQTVRFNFRPPSDLAAGEYRSHLLLQVIPDISEPTATFGSEGPQENVGIRVFMQMSFSIPVVVRHDIDAPQVAIANVKPVPVNDGKRLGLELTFSREGDASSYGRVSVEMQLDENSPVEKIGEYGELSIYQEVDKRQITIPLRDAKIPAGALVRVAYEGLMEYKGILWAEQVFRAK